MHGLSKLPRESEETYAVYATYLKTYALYNGAFPFSNIAIFLVTKGGRESSQYARKIT